MARHLTRSTNPGREFHQGSASMPKGLLILLLAVACWFVAIGAWQLTMALFSTLQTLLIGVQG